MFWGNTHNQKLYKLLTSQDFQTNMIYLMLCSHCLACSNDNSFLYSSFSYQAVAKMVQECYKYVDTVTDQPIKLRLIDTLRTVTAGKVCNVY